MSVKVVVIAGGGPAGLTAAFELTRDSENNTSVVLFEATDSLGGISRTVFHNGNRMDLGGHRFFTKNRRVAKLWESVMPVSEEESFCTEKMEKTDGNECAMIRRKRVSHILYLQHFFNYPMTLSWDTLKALGINRTIKVIKGYIIAKYHSLEEISLEDFFINRFGRPLYQMFFEDYTEKVWGLHPSKLSSDWGTQRIKRLSLRSVLSNMLLRKIGYNSKSTETSLIEQFIYPKYGPGQFWDTIAEKTCSCGGQIIRNSRVIKINIVSDVVTHITTENEEGGITVTPCDVFISSMPIIDLINCIEGIDVPIEIKRIAENLPFRDFITVGLLVGKLTISKDVGNGYKETLIPDTWIYIQDRRVKLGRLQIFNNWSPYLIKDSDKVWIGLEYFCNKDDKLWGMSDDDFIDMAIYELELLGIISKDDIYDSVRIKVEKAYPSYHGTYKEFGKVRKFLDSIKNLYCIGRNGQHRYNNMDHSMLTALEAVDIILSGYNDKTKLWNVNTENNYHE